MLFFTGLHRIKELQHWSISQYIWWPMQGSSKEFSSWSFLRIRFCFLGQSYYSSGSENATHGCWFFYPSCATKMWYNKQTGKMNKKKGKEKHLVNSRRATFLLLFIISIQRQNLPNSIQFLVKRVRIQFLFFQFGISIGMFLNGCGARLWLKPANIAKRGVEGGSLVLVLSSHHRHRNPYLDRANITCPVSLSQDTFDEIC